MPKSGEGIPGRSSLCHFRSPKAWSSGLHRHRVRGGGAELERGLWQDGPRLLLRGRRGEPVCL